MSLHERFLRIKQTVKDAIAAHHTFMIYGKSRVIRDCMLKRGWCEKFYRRNSTGNKSFCVQNCVQKFALLSTATYKTENYCISQSISKSRRIKISFRRSAFWRRFQPHSSIGRYRRFERSAERTSIDIEDAYQSHSRLLVEHGVRLARLARARQQNHCVQSILSSRFHVQGILSASLVAIFLASTRTLIWNLLRLRIMYNFTLIRN